MTARNNKKTSGRKKASTRSAPRKSAPAAVSGGKRRVLLDRSTAGRRDAALEMEVVRRTTNRQGAVADEAGEPPDGPVTQAALEAEIAAWIAKPRKRASDYCAYKYSRVMKDAKEMRAGRADLPRFAAKRTPITGRNFDWLDLISTGLADVGDDEAETEGDQETIGENSIKAQDDVKDARTALAVRATACGIPLVHFTIKDSYGDPEALFNAAARAARQARRKLHRFNDEDYALQLIENLEEKLEVLRVLIEGKDDLNSDKLDTAARRAALKRLLFDCITFIGSWGKDATLGDTTRVKVYALDNIFPTRTTGAADDEPGEDVVEEEEEETSTPLDGSTPGKRTATTGNGDGKSSPD